MNKLFALNPIDPDRRETKAKAVRRLRKNLKENGLVRLEVYISGQTREQLENFARQNQIKWGNQPHLTRAGAVVIEMALKGLSVEQTPSFLEALELTSVNDGNPTDLPASKTVAKSKPPKNKRPPAS